MVEKDGAWLNDAKIAAGRDSNLNTIPIKVDSDGAVIIDAGIVSVLPAAVFPVSQSGTWTVNLATEPTINIGVVDQGTPGVSPWPISGTVFIAAGNFVYNEIFTIPATGAIHTPNISYRTFAIQVKGTGATPSAWNVVLEGSIDGTNYTPILIHTQALTELILWSGTNFYPVSSYRIRVTSLTLGGASNIIVTVLGTS